MVLAAAAASPAAATMVVAAAAASPAASVPACRGHEARGLRWVLLLVLLRLLAAAFVAVAGAAGLVAEDV